MRHIFVILAFVICSSFVITHSSFPPYFSPATCCRWLRGNHHGHSTVSDGKAEPMEEVAAYETAGYDYFALSEHDTFLNPDQLQSRTAMCVLAAVEVTSCYGQTLMFLGADEALPRK